MCFAFSLVSHCWPLPYMKEERKTWKCTDLVLSTSFCSLKGEIPGCRENYHPDRAKQTHIKADTKTVALDQL